jgi:hypothetical protein
MGSLAAFSAGLLRPIVDTRRIVSLDVSQI